MPEKILVVDDDLDSLKLIGLMLQRQGYEVTAANVGQQAIAKAQAEHPDLIILDVMMPDMNGYEVCRRLRANAETREIPIIMFTAKTLIDDKVAGFEAGADDYLTKPTHPAELASRIRTILARHPSPQRKHEKTYTIGFLGAKGGVGTSTLATNVAAALQVAGEAPLLTDLRLGNGSLGLALNMRSQQGIGQVLNKAAADIRQRTVEEQIVTHPTGLRLLLSSVMPKEGMINYSAETAIAAVKAMRPVGKPTILDLGSGYNPIVSRLQPEIDLMVVVVEPLAVTLNMARELAAELQTNRSSKVQIVVVNRTQYGMQIPWHEVEQVLGQEIRAIISSATELTFQAMQVGQPLVNLQPNAIVSSQIVKLSEDLYTRVQAGEPTR